MSPSKSTDGDDETAPGPDSELIASLPFAPIVTTEIHPIGTVEGVLKTTEQVQRRMAELGPGTAGGPLGLLRRAGRRSWAAFAALEPIHNDSWAGP
jgi:hypothetical protein